MTVKLTGEVGCRLCDWTGEPKDLTEEEDKQVIKCPNCGGILIDMRHGLIMQNLNCTGEVNIEA